MISLLVGCSKEPPEAVESPPAETLGLRDYASAKGKFIGNLMRDGMFENEQVNGGSTDKILRTEYNAIVLGNKMKMSNLLRNRPQDPFNIKITDINTGNIDKFVAYADKHQIGLPSKFMIFLSPIFLHYLHIRLGKLMNGM
jgi:hypothetical protein